MKNLIFDIEADGLTPSKIWCIVAKDLDSNTVYEYGPDKLEEGIELLRNSETCLLYTSPSPRDQRGSRLPS